MIGQRPLLSIILPNYNHIAFLEQRLESIFQQTYQNFELILLDDASTDGSELILKRYENHPKVTQLIINSQNSGSPFKQWQKGINLAKGEYVWIAESDDYCDPEFLKILVMHIESNTTLVYCASMNVDENGNEIGLNRNQVCLDKSRWLTDFSNNGKNEIKKYLRFLNTIPNASAVLFKRSLVKPSYFAPHLKYCGDWIFWIHLLKCGNVKYISTPLNYFRFHPNSSRSAKCIEKDAAMFIEFFTVIRKEGSTFMLMWHALKYSWIPKALRLFSKKYPKGAIFKRLQKKDQWLLRFWAYHYKIKQLCIGLKKRLK